jgi:hypothetical protein
MTTTILPTPSITPRPAFVVPCMPIQRPRYAIAPAGRTYLADRIRAACARGGELGSLEADLLTAWQEAMDWLAQTPDAWGAPAGATADDLDPATDRIRQCPLPEDLPAILNAMHRIPETITNLQVRLWVRLVTHHRTAVTA